MLRKLFKKRIELAEEKMDEYLRGKYKLIKKVKGGDCVLNFKCHMQAISDSLKNGTEIVMVLYNTRSHLSFGCFTGDRWAVHFLNYDKKKKTYIDNTIGGFAACTDYLFIRKVGTYEDIVALLKENNKKMRNTRAFFKIRPKQMEKIL